MNMIKPIMLTALSCFALIQVQAQNLYMPRDIQKAFNKGTRQADGNPGKKYWQNHAFTTLLLPPCHQIEI